MCPYCGRKRCGRPDPEEVQELKDELKEWKDARRALASAQSYTLGKRSLTRASLREVRSMITELENELEDLYHCRGRGARVIIAIPRDSV